MFRIGYMEYANAYPIFYYLLQDSDISLERGVPATLNKAMREQKIDISPSSSIEYARNPNLYNIISGLSISSVGPVKSVDIFSHIPIKNLSGRKIFFTRESNTSTVLTRIILEKFYNIMPVYTQNKEEADAELLIGDKALYEYYNTDYEYIIDLGQEWYSFTGLPFVFALWIANKNAYQHPDFKFLADRLRKYAFLFPSNSNNLLKKYIDAGFTESQMTDYWKIIDYNLSPKHIEGLTLFYKYAFEIGETLSQPEINFC